MADKAKGPKAGAAPGKTKGKGTVTKAAAKKAKVDPVNLHNVDGAAEQAFSAAEEEAFEELEARHAKAWEAGRAASVNGYPSRPPVAAQGYNESECIEWYKGYKSHANPDSDKTVGDLFDGEDEGQEG